MTLAEDFLFAQDQPQELTSDATIMRYVAAINPEASRSEFIAAAVAAGYRADSAGKRFYESRRFDRENNDMQFDAEGREVLPA